MSTFIEYFSEKPIESARGIYSLLGLQVTGCGIKFENIEIVFTNCGEAERRFLLSIEIDSDLDEMELNLVDFGVEIVERSLDVSGPYFVMRDPLGLYIRVGLSRVGVSRAVSHAS